MLFEISESNGEQSNVTIQTRSNDGVKFQTFEQNMNIINND